MKENTGLRKTTLAALFLAIGLILPFITMQIPAVGKMLLSNAYTDIVMRLCLRITIRTDRWDHHTSFERSFVWDAGNFSKCSMHGI